MRTVMTIATILAGSVVAHADVNEGTHAAPRVDLGLGVMAGVHLHMGGPMVNVEASFRPIGEIWIHARVGQGHGDAPGGDGPFDVHSTDVELGVDYRPCVLDGVVCGVVGAGLDLDRSRLGVPLETQWSELAVGRVGLDVGSRHLRVRPTIEGGYSLGWPREVALLAASLTAVVAW